jgi:hypothetical protein
VDNLGGDESASPARTAEVCGENGGSTAMASMRDWVSVGVGISRFWSQAVAGRRSN